jgi:uncharacterized caspase-like protein
MTRRTGTAMLGGLLFLLSAVAAQADKRVALVIGNSAYQNAPALANPVRDAQAMAAMFQKAGFEVVNARYDAGHSQFAQALRQFEDAVANSDIAVVYYSGHGIEIHGVNYVIPVDAKLASDWDIDDEAITLDRLIAPVTEAKRLGLVIVDAMRDNPFVQTMKLQRRSKLITPGQGRVEPNTVNTLIAYAAKAGTTALERDGDQSLFTAALLHNLFVPGLDVRLAFGRTREEVLERSGNRQEPFVYGVLGGTIVALVPAPAADSDAAGNLEQVKNDYALISKIGTRKAWEVFLAQYPTGFYADLARAQLADRAAREGLK